MRKDSLTSKNNFMARRAFLQKASAAGLLMSAPLVNSSALDIDRPCIPLALDAEHLSTKKSVLSYNNYYEFTTNKKMVRHLVNDFDVTNWTLNIGGLVEQPLSFNLQQILSLPSCSRTYRFRCIEGWSAVIPWNGIELRRILDLVKPLSSARYLKFKSAYRPEQMPGQRTKILTWPYTECLRLDEAYHPLVLLATGMYDDALPKQNGYPIRLVVPWKYGFKNIKAITSIKLVESKPLGSWQKAVPSEYGFFGNVNPNLAHPRWSQRRELPLGASKKVRTHFLNGYAKHVASLYSDQDLKTL